VFKTVLAASSISGATSTALAGGGRAAVDSNESCILNPASLAHLDGASLTLSTYFFQHPSQNYDSKAWRLSISENSPLNELPLALSYAHISNFKSQQNDFWFSGGNFISPFVSIGFAYHYSEWKAKFNQLSGLAKSPLLFENNASLGVLVTPNPELGFSFVAQDFIKQTEKLSANTDTDAEGDLNNNTDSLAARVSINAMKIGIGAVFLYDSFLRFHADVLSNESSVYRHNIQVSLGIENMVNEWVLTRWGLAHTNLAYSNSENLALNTIAFGMGFLGPRFEVYLATKQNSGFQSTREHSIDFHIPF
jgi:hypothetical protein